MCAEGRGYWVRLMGLVGSAVALAVYGPRHTYGHGAARLRALGARPSGLGVSAPLPPIWCPRPHAQIQAHSGEEARPRPVCSPAFLQASRGPSLPCPASSWKPLAVSSSGRASPLGPVLLRLVWVAYENRTKAPGVRVPWGLFWG